MAYQVVWSPEAIEDVESIAEYIEKDSEYYAYSVVTKLLDVARYVEDFPLTGRIVPEFGKESIREKFVYSYRFIYKIEGQKVIILAVIHGKRVLENILDSIHD